MVELMLRNHGDGQGKGKRKKINLKIKNNTRFYLLI